MRNKNLTAAAAVATAAALMLFTAKTGTQTIGVTFGWLLSFFCLCPSFCGILERKRSVKYEY